MFVIDYNLLLDNDRHFCDFIHEFILAVDLLSLNSYTYYSNRLWISFFIDLSTSYSSIMWIFYEFCILIISAWRVLGLSVFDLAKDELLPNGRKVCMRMSSSRKFKLISCDDLVRLSKF